jgi:DNA-binding MarR family transcriptional regulator
MALLRQDRLALKNTLERTTLWADVDARMEIAGMQIFLVAALNEGASYQEIQKHSHVTRSSTSRWLLYWGTGPYSHNSVRRVGQGYLRTESDPMDNRIKRVYLTEKGRGLVRQLLALETKHQPARVKDGTSTDAERAMAD